MTERQTGQKGPGSARAVTGGSGANGLMILLQIQHENNFLPTSINTDKPKLVTFLVLVCTTALFIVQIL